MADERLLNRPLLLCSIASLAQGISFNLFLHLPGFLNGLGAGESSAIALGADCTISTPVAPTCTRTLVLVSDPQ